jgi:hypothetical protein
MNIKKTAKEMIERLEITDKQDKDYVTEVLKLVRDTVRLEVAQERVRELMTVVGK